MTDLLYNYGVYETRFSLYSGLLSYFSRPPVHFKYMPSTDNYSNRRLYNAYLPIIHASII